MAVLFEVAMPTCDAPGPFALKNTRSPAWTFDRDTGAPTLNCWNDVRGSEIPACLNAHWTKPEQSNPPGCVPPDAYGVPILERAAPTAEPPPPELVGALCVLPLMPSADIVAGPTTPSTSSPWPAWNAFTAARDWGPYTPSAESPSFC